MTGPTPADRVRDLLEQLASEQVRWTSLWHSDTSPATSASASPGDLPALVCTHHRSNFSLWHEEDCARDPAIADHEIARIKRSIDQLNQRRNDLVEQIDQLLFQLAGPQPATAPLHSETPGSMLDRLSILALKRFHTQEQIDRPGAPDTHRARNRDRLAVLERQHADLLGCLLDLWSAVGLGQRRFGLYRQLKMYNDPDLNPVLYRRAPPTTPAPDS